MHRAYQPLTPANNIFLKRRWDQDYFEAHRKKVVAAKSMIDNKPPKTYMHLHIKLKKLQMEGERLAIVERDNRILLEKMAHIMRTGGRVNNKKHDYVQKSLNKTKRQRELLRITHENLAILKRITSKEPTYSHHRWEEEWHANQAYMMNISKFPHYWRPEQTSYMARKEQQAVANRRIREQVNESNDFRNSHSPDRYSNNRNSISVSPDRISNSLGNRGRANHRDCNANSLSPDQKFNSSGRRANHRDSNANSLSPDQKFNSSGGRTNHRNSNANSLSSEPVSSPESKRDKNVRIHKLGSSEPNDKDLFS